MSYGKIQKSPDSIIWQDYRASNTGMVVFYASDPISEVPVREIPEDIDSPMAPEPNYETGTYGFYGCSKTKIRGAFAKSKLRYLFFLTKYAGTKDGFKDKMLVTGYFRIAKTADVQKLHLRYLDEYSCVDAPGCIALRADDVHFVSLSDAFEVTADQLKTWGFNAKVSKQLRIILSPEHTTLLLDALKAKKNQRDAYIMETKRLSPNEDAEEKSDHEADLAGRKENAVSGDPEAVEDASSQNQATSQPVEQADASVQQNGTEPA
jgi:hypothetical protein